MPKINIAQLQDQFATCLQQSPRLRLLIAQFLERGGEVLKDYPVLKEQVANPMGDSYLSKKSKENIVVDMNKIDLIEHQVYVQAGGVLRVVIGNENDLPNPLNTVEHITLIRRIGGKVKDSLPRFDVFYVPKNVSIDMQGGFGAVYRGMGTMVLEKQTAMASFDKDRMIAIGSDKENRSPSESVLLIKRHTRQQNIRVVKKFIRTNIDSKSGPLYEVVRHKALGYTNIKSRNKKSTEDANYVFQDVDGGYLVIMHDLGDINLATLLHNNPSLSTNDRFMIAIAIIVAYLNDFPNHVHHDIKPQNILLRYKDGQWTAKFVDVGFVNQHGADIRAYGTAGYSGPEGLYATVSGGEGDPLLINPRKLTTISAAQSQDIYSLGVVLQEIFGMLPSYHLYHLVQLQLAMIQWNLLSTTVTDAVWHHIGKPQFGHGLFRKIYDLDGQSQDALRTLFTEMMCSIEQQRPSIEQVSTALQTAYQIWQNTPKAFAWQMYPVEVGIARTSVSRLVQSIDFMGEILDKLEYVCSTEKNSILESFARLKSIIYSYDNLLENSPSAENVRAVINGCEDYRYSIQHTLLKLLNFMVGSRHKSHIVAILYLQSCNNGEHTPLTSHPHLLTQLISSYFVPAIDRVKAEIANDGDYISTYYSEVGAFFALLQQLEHASEASFDELAQAYHNLLMTKYRGGVSGESWALITKIRTLIMTFVKLMEEGAATNYVILGCYNRLLVVITTYSILQKLYGNLTALEKYRNLYALSHHLRQQTNQIINHARQIDLERIHPDDLDSLSSQFRSLPGLSAIMEYYRANSRKNASMPVFTQVTVLAIHLSSKAHTVIRQLLEYPDPRASYNDSELLTALVVKQQVLMKTMESLSMQQLELTDFLYQYNELVGGFWEVIEYGNDAIQQRNQALVTTASAHALYLEPDRREQVGSPRLT